MRAEARAVLDGLLRGVPARSREVLRLRFEQAQAQIGVLFGVSQMQISRFIRDAIAQLRYIAEQQQRIAEERTAAQPASL